MNKTRASCSGFKDVLKNEALDLFIRKMKEFDTMFCDRMCDGSDFTIKLEVRGNACELLHVNVINMSMDRPSSAGKNKSDARSIEQGV